MPNLLLVFLFFAFYPDRMEREIYISIRASATVGSGTVTDPYNGDTPARFDAIFATVAAQQERVTFKLAPGVYRTRGTYQHWVVPWYAKNGWSIQGSGMGSTTIKLDAPSYGAGSAFADMVVFNLGGGNTYALKDISISDLTIDGSFADFGSPLAADFTVPNVSPTPSNTVQLTLVSTAWATPAHLGKQIYIQRADNKLPIGRYELVSIDSSTKVTLKNIGADPGIIGQIQQPPGTTVAAAGGVQVSLSVRAAGLVMPGKRSRVQNVRVKNIGCPVYEGPLGIAITREIASTDENPPDGNEVTGCLVDHTWGQWGWMMSAFSNDPTQGASCTWVGNTILGSGYDAQGFGGYLWSRSVIVGNRCRNVSDGVYSDSGPSIENVVTGNTFESVDRGAVFGAVARDRDHSGWVIQDNVFSVKSTGIYFLGLNTGSTVANNVIRAVSGNSPVDFQIQDRAGFLADNIAIAGNVVAAGVTRTLIPGPQTATRDELFVPPGTLADYAGVTAPDGWLLCDGRAISRTACDRLFAAIGVTYGPGDGSTTFNLPDCRGRVTAGRDDMGGTAAGRLTNSGVGNPGINGATLGAAGGADRWTLGLNEIPAHYHNISWPQLSYLWAASSISNTTTGGGATRVTSTPVATVPPNTAAAGSGQAHPNVQPTIVFQKIIKL